MHKWPFKLICHSSSCGFGCSSLLPRDSLIYYDEKTLRFNVISLRLPSITNYMFIMLILPCPLGIFKCHEVQ